MGRLRFNRTRGPVGQVGVRVYRAILCAQRNGSDTCLLAHKSAYLAVAHMLEADGLVAVSNSREYHGTLRRLKNAIDAGPHADIESLLYQRLLDHLKKNNRAGRPVFKAKELGCESRFGYSASALREHIESLFTPGMSWGRVAKGDIQIDHKYPARAFDLSTQSGVHRAYALNNLQPLWRGDNVRKGYDFDRPFIELFGEGVFNDGIY